MSEQGAFDFTREMVRPTDLQPAHMAAVMSLPTVEANRLLILKLMVTYGPITMFDPYVLMGSWARWKQTAIGPRFKRLREQGLIRQVESRRPLAGAESSNLVSAFEITTAGRGYLEEHNA